MSLPGCQYLAKSATVSARGTIAGFTLRGAEATVYPRSDTQAARACVGPAYYIGPDHQSLLERAGNQCMGTRNVDTACGGALWCAPDIKQESEDMLELVDSDKLKEQCAGPAVETGGCLSLGAMLSIGIVPSALKSATTAVSVELSDSSLEQPLLRVVPASSPSEPEGSSRCAAAPMRRAAPTGGTEAPAKSRLRDARLPRNRGAADSAKSRDTPARRLDPAKPADSSCSSLASSSHSACCAWDVNFRSPLTPRQTSQGRPESRRRHSDGWCPRARRLMTAGRIDANCVGVASAVKSPRASRYTVKRGWG